MKKFIQKMINCITRRCFRPPLCDCNCRTIASLPELSGDLDKSDMFAVNHNGETFQYNMFNFSKWIINHKLMEDMLGSIYIKLKKEIVEYIDGIKKEIEDSIRDSIKNELDKIRDDVKNELDKIRDDVKNELDKIRDEIKDELDNIRDEIGSGGGTGGGGGTEKSIKFNPEVLSFGSGVETKYLQVIFTGITDTSFILYNVAPWITVTKEAGNMLKVVSTANPSNSYRAGQIGVQLSSDSSMFAAIMVTQSGSSTNPDDYITSANPWLLVVGKNASCDLVSSGACQGPYSHNVQVTDGAVYLAWNVRNASPGLTITKVLAHGIGIGYGHVKFSWAENTTGDYLDRTFEVYLESNPSIFKTFTLRQHPTTPVI